MFEHIGKNHQIVSPECSHLVLTNIESAKRKFYIFWQDKTLIIRERDLAAELREFTSEIAKAAAQVQNRGSRVQRHAAFFDPLNRILRLQPVKFGEPAAMSEKTGDKFMDDHSRSV